MKTFLLCAALCAGLAVGSQAQAQAPAQAPAQGRGGGVNFGTLSCHVASGWGFVFGSSRSLKCAFSGRGRVEDYDGSINRFGVDIGYLRSGVIVWNVFAPTAELAPGALAGTYAGAGASAAVGVGLGANVLVGGSGGHIALQPLSIQGKTGLNAAAGITSITLRFVPPQTSHEPPPKGAPPPKK